MSPTTSCLYNFNAADECYKCPSINNKWLSPVDGKCVYDCPAGYYPNPQTEQCRNCHTNCTTCLERTENNCTSCSGILYLYNVTSTCVDNCIPFNLTKSVTPGEQKCVTCIYYNYFLVDAYAELANNLNETIINTFSFTNITIDSLNATSTNYTMSWGVDINQTIALNPSYNMTFDPAGPFLSGINNLTAIINPKFFELDKKYAIRFNITDNLASGIVKELNWTLVTNSAPKGKFN